MESWFKRLENEIGSKDFHSFNDPIEDISWKIEDNATLLFNTPQIINSSCNLDAFTFHYVENESICNEQLLQDLNQGANRILLEWNKLPNFDVVFKNVLFEYVQCHLTIKNKGDLSSVLSWIEKVQSHSMVLETLFDVNESPTIFQRKISGFNVYAVGGNCVQELTYIILELNRIASVGKIKNVIIEMGVGENFLFESAKIIALKWLSEAVRNFYKSSIKITFRAKIGWRNKSQSNEHLNQIKQTTEALSAIIGGVNEVCVTPYDFCYKNPPEPFVRRMAINTSHILREEAHLSRFKSLDQGSIILQNLAKKLADECWMKMEQLKDNPNKEEIQKDLLLETIKRRNSRLEKWNNDLKITHYGFGDLPFYFF